jgi:hypothetical protein
VLKCLANSSSVSHSGLWLSVDSLLLTHSAPSPTRCTGRGRSPQLAGALLLVVVLLLCRCFAADVAAAAASFDNPHF